MSDRRWSTLVVFGLVAGGCQAGSEGGGPAVRPTAPAPAQTDAPPAKDVVKDMPEKPAAGPTEDPTAEAGAAPRAGAKISLKAKLVDSAAGATPIELFSPAGGAVATSGSRYATLAADGAAPAWKTLPETPELEGVGFELVGGAGSGFAVASLIRSRTASKRALLSWSGSEWTRVPPASGDDGLYVDFAAWTNGRTLAVSHVDMWSARDPKYVGRIDVLGEPAPRSLSMPAGVRPVAVATSPSGQVFAVVARDEPTGEAYPTFEGAAHVARWGPDGQGPVAITPLPALGGRTPQAGDVRTIAALRDDEVWLAGGVGRDRDEAWTPYVVRFDGTTWAVQALPREFVGLVEGVVRCGDGVWFQSSALHGPGTARWVAGRADRPQAGMLWKRDGDGGWSEATVALDRAPPKSRNREPQRPRGLACVGEHGLWLSLAPFTVVLEVDWDTAPLNTLAFARLATG
jgi:hypothetical protein